MVTGLYDLVVGTVTGMSVGGVEAVGFTVGAFVGVFEGDAVGAFEGRSVGDLVGVFVGLKVGEKVGALEGLPVGGM
jgi:hypothetical protein